MRTLLKNATVFDGIQTHTNATLIIEAGFFTNIQRDKVQTEDDDIVHDVEGHLLIPGFIDLQVNGGGGVLLNEEPTVSTIKKIAMAHARYGTTSMLPTLITDSLDSMCRAIAAVDQAIADGVPGVVGIHLEGPLLNARKKGVHSPERMCLPNEELFGVLTSLRHGKTIVTLAPEMVSASFIASLAEKGIVICAGHTAATFEQTLAAVNAGVSGFTHLYNAMSPLTGREPGAVGAALSTPETWAGIIMDGLHVHPASARTALRAKGGGSVLLVTDAMSVVGTSDTSFELQGETIAVVDGRCVAPSGSLAGSALDMMTAVINAENMLDVTFEEAIRMATVYPAKAIGMEDQLGRIAAGYRANIVELDAKRSIHRVWVDGAIVRPSSEVAEVG